MTLNHSKTWPINTFAIVQLRLDSDGHIYSSLSDGVTSERKGKGTAAMDSDDRPILKAPLSLPENGALAKSYDEFLDAKCNNNRLSETIRNNASFTQRTPVEIPNDVDENSSKENGSVLPLSRKHLEMLTKISPPPPQFRTTVRTDTVSTILDQEYDFDGGNEEGRRPSIRVDNWDYIYTERSSCSNVNEARVRCPIHRYGPERPDLRRDSSEPELPLDARKSATLRRHYYPEGSWGWVVVVCSVLVHLLNHGLQLSSSQLVAPGVEKFKIERVHLADFPIVEMTEISPCCNINGVRRVDRVENEEKEDTSSH